MLKKCEITFSGLLKHIEIPILMYIEQQIWNFQGRNETHDVKNIPNPAGFDLTNFILRALD
jgi:hypothetical protein